MTQTKDAKYFKLLKRGTYVSKSAYGELLIRFKAMQKAFGNMFADREKIDKKYWAFQKSFSELQEKNTALETAIDYKRKRVNEVLGENKALKERNQSFQMQYDSANMDRERFLKERDEESRIAKFNFRWAMIATGTTAACLLYLITR